MNDDGGGGMYFDTDFKKNSCNYCLFVDLELNGSFLELPAMSINEFVCLI